MRITRRNFSRVSALAGIAFMGRLQGAPDETKTPVAIVKTTDRKSGFQKAVDLIGGVSYSGKDVYLKCSYSSPDPYPGTTHPDSLRAATALIKAKGGRRISLIERSGMGITREILGRLNTLELAQQLGIACLPLEELAAEEWHKADLPGAHWTDGIEIPKFLVQKPCVVQLCNLKTHRFGGQFSASLKNSIGLIAKYSSIGTRRNYMQELHASQYQCEMIAEVNLVLSMDLILMDAIEIFVKGGPESGELAYPGIIAASRDRVALDAVGLALLRNSGVGFPLNQGAILKQAQLRRAVELGFGIRSEKEITLVADDRGSRSMAFQLENLLQENSE
jgi:uncharacterized protein (DUF362 family)